MRILFLLVGACASAYATADTIETVPPATTISEVSYSVGLAAGIAPRYIGSKESRPVALPLFAIKTPKGFFATTTDGVGYSFASPTGFFGSSAVTYDPGRKDKKSANRPGSDYLGGMGEIPGSAVNALQLGFAITPQFAVVMSSKVPLTQRNRGIDMRTAIRWGAVKGSHDVVSLEAGIRIGDKKYNQTFFGVSDAQSLSSDFAKYASHAGIYGADATLAWTHTLTPKWSVASAITATGLLGDAARSPIVQKRSSIQAFSGVMYTF